MPDIISRTDAIARGLRRYFTGKPCRRGHIGERRVKDYVCLECERVYDKEYDQQPESKAKDRERNRLRYHQTPELKARTKIGAVNWRAVKQFKAEGTHTQEEFLAVCDDQSWKCDNPFCGKDISGVGKAGAAKAHRDHMRDLKNGGRNDISNIHALCSNCNGRKGSMDWLAFWCSEWWRFKAAEAELKINEVERRAKLNAARMAKGGNH
jgi:5-methylcytosine-specific restriction endonuclease McrA